MVRANLKALALATILAAPALARVANPQFAEAGLTVRQDDTTATTTDDTTTTTTDGTTTDDTTTTTDSGKPEDGKPEDGKPEDGKPEDGKPEDGYPHDGYPHDGYPHDGYPHDGEPHDGYPHDGEPHDGGYGGSAWSPVSDSCSPSYEEYECEKDNGDWETTTVTVYSSGCPGWHEPTPLPAWESWAPVDPGHPHYPKPTDSWSSYPEHDDHKPHPPPGWYEWDSSWGPKPSTWDEWKYAPATTWSSWDPKPTWSSYPDNGYYAPEGWYEWDYSKGAKPAHWDDWKHGIKGDDWKQGEYEYQWDNYGKKYVVVTIVEVYKVPCSTGWEDKTTTLYTTHCGCTETPVPKTPEYVTLTTTCPESWGLGKTVVTYSTPTCSWTPDAASTWLTYAVKTPVSADSSSTWATWSGYSKTPVSADTTSTWATAAIKTPAAATAQWSGVAKWQGAASSVMISKAMVGGAGMVAALAYFL